MTDSTTMTDKTIKTDSVATPSETIFFDTTISPIQFIKEVDDYSKTVVNNVPPKPCSEYVLRFITGFPKGRGPDSPVGMDTMLYKHTLCEDIKRFEEIHNKSLKNDSPYGCWYYRFRPIGEKYYIIEGEQMINAISKVTLYYQRKE